MPRKDTMFAENPEHIAAGQYYKYRMHIPARYCGREFKVIRADIETYELHDNCGKTVESFGRGKILLECMTGAMRGAVVLVDRPQILRHFRRIKSLTKEPS